MLYMGTSRPSVHTSCCVHLYTSTLPENASLRTDRWAIDLFRSRHPVWKKEFGAKPSEKKMMMKRKMRRLEAKPEHESRSIQRVSSRCKWSNNYQYLMYKFILAICNPIRCSENSTCIKFMPILNEKFFLHALFLRYYLTCDSLYWLFIIDFKVMYYASYVASMINSNFFHLDRSWAWLNTCFIADFHSCHPFLPTAMTAY